MTVIASPAAPAARFDATTPPATLNVIDIIDQQRSRSVQFAVCLICAGVNFCDSFSIQAVDYAGPSIRDAFRLSPAQLGVVFSISLFGMMVGSLGIGPIADRIGRRRPLIILTLLFGGLTALTVTTTEYWQLVTLRLLDGIALGAAIPNSYVLSAEYSPAKSRRLMVGLMVAGYTIGGFVAGVVAGALIAATSWKLIFLVGGGAALITATFGWLFLPESLHFLASQKDRRAEFDRIVSKIAPQYTEFLGRKIVTAPKPDKISVQTLFQPEYILLTLGLWVVAFTCMLSVYLFLSWTPILLKDLGIRLDKAILITAMYFLGSGVGAPWTGWLMDRMNPGRVLVVMLVAGSAAVALVGLFLGNEIAMGLASLSLGLTLGGALAGMGLLAATVYPPWAGVTGAGWAISIGRFGSIVGPALAAAWLSAGLNGADIYFAAVAPTLLAAVVILLCWRRVLRA